MEWLGLIGKNVFIKLEDGTVFTDSKVITYEEPFLSIIDKYNYPVLINIKQIIRIRVEEKDVN